MSAAARCTVVREESRARIVVAVYLLQEDVLARMDENTRIGIVNHGRVADFEALQMQVLCRNHNRRGVHCPFGGAVAMLFACCHGEVGRVKNWALAWVGQVMDAVVVAFAACGQQDARRHLVSFVKDGIVQIVNSTANPNGVARAHDFVRLVERREGLFLRAGIAVVTVGCNVIHGTERLCGSQNNPKCKHELFSHTHL